MKTIAGEFAFFMRGKARQNLKVLLLYCLFLLVMALTYAKLFQHFMWTLEGRHYSYIAGIYWVITVMTTLGFGDITFHTDEGYIFAGIVTVSGVVFLLILLPFGIVSMFLAPWIEHRLRFRPALTVPEGTKGHILIFGMDSVTRALIRKLQAQGIPFFITMEKFEEVQRLEEDEGIRAVYGNPSDAEVLKRLLVSQARQIIANLGDTDNTNLILTVRALCATPIAAIVEEPRYADILKLAGADQVIPLKQILGHYLAIRATTKGASAHVLDSFGELLIAELPVYGTPFAGLRLSDARIREDTGMTIIGVWERGKMVVPTAETLLPEDGVIVLLAKQEQLDALEKMVGGRAEDDLVVILGHGRIGCSAATFLDNRQIPFVLVDKIASTDCTEHIVVMGDATSPSLLKGAAIEDAKGLIATTNDDGVNIFFTLASRHINPHIRIVARANREENVDELYAAGADFVVSNASVGATILMNILEKKESVFLSEGMQIFRYRVPAAMDGMTLASSRIRTLTGSTVIAILPSDDTEAAILPPPETVLRQGMTLMFVGTSEQEIRSRTLFRGKS
ncbi:TrkA family potassium uptake protein [Geobacter sp. DSM 9736]|uniref:potassium channel family protein n=1 Tax=Geobacter sp. DSM 9736 TaxID=1277350 RepID=UPI000B50AB70|nr:potassium channel protein [Geobacter sp. DSM 9736]SNB45323.1 Trk K+ transport system, NAD-binding component [Geobacter sp. DSM 9736]